MKTPLTLFEEFDKEKEQLASFLELEILGPEPHPDYDTIINLCCQIAASPIALLCLADKSHIWYKNNVRWAANDHK